MGFKWLLFGFLALIVGGCSDSGSASDDHRPWRVLADEHLVGGSFEVGAMTATASDQYHTMWAALGVESDEPAVDFDEEVVVAYTASYSSGCE